jgi:hypothetical protein
MFNHGPYTEFLTVPPFYLSRPPSSARLLYGKLLLLLLKSTQGISRTPIHLGNPG